MLSVKMRFLVSVGFFIPEEVELAWGGNLEGVTCCVREGLVGYQEKILPKGWLGTGKAPQGIVTAPNSAQQHQKYSCIVPPVPSTNPNHHPTPSMKEMPSTPPKPSPAAQNLNECSV